MTNIKKILSTSTHATSSAIGPLSLELMMESLKNVKPVEFPNIVLEICRKHWKKLDKEFGERLTSAEPCWMGKLTGIQIVIKPYLKKPRLVKYSWK